MTLTRPYSYIVLIVVSLLAFYPVCFNQFQYFWDDQWVVLNRFSKAGVTPGNIRDILTRFFHGQYAPVNELSYLFLYSTFGEKPFWFHLFGLLVHTANVLLVYTFIYRLLEQARGFQQASINRIALLTAMLLAVHPFLVESVAWVSASKIIIYVMFYLVSLLFYLRFTNTGRWKYYIWALVFFTISFGAKEQAVVMPACLLLIDHVLGRSLRSGRVWKEKLPFLILALLFGLVTMLSQSANGVGVLSSRPSYPLHQNLVFASYAYTEYFVKCVLPVKLSYLYPFPNQIGEALPARFWVYPVIIAAALFFLWSFWRQRWVAFGMLFFTIHIAIVLHIVPLSRFTIVADRYVYLSSVGVFFLLAYFFDMAIQKSAAYRNVLVASAIMYMLYLGIYSHIRIKVWYDSESLKKELRELIMERSDYEQLKNKYR